MRTKLVLTIVLVAACGLAAAVAEKGAGKGSVALFNGKDLSGWKLFLPDKDVDPATVWSVKQEGGTAVIHCTGKPAGYMRTEKEYGNYRLRLEWRWPEKPGNSGVLLHVGEPDKVWPKSIEAQLYADNAGDFWVIDGTDFKEHTDKSERRVPKAAASNEKPAGEWNQYEIVCSGNTIKVSVNGVLQNQATEATVAKGYIALQSEGAPIEFRNITLEPLEE